MNTRENIAVSTYTGDVNMPGNMPNKRWKEL